MGGPKALAGGRFGTSVGESTFNEDGHDTGRFDYLQYHPLDLRLDFFRGDGLSGYAALGFEISHGSAATLGSSRWILGLDGGLRFQKPLSANWAFVTEGGLGIATGVSKLSLGNGEGPVNIYTYDEHGVKQVAYEFVPSATLRLGPSYKNFDLLFGVRGGLSTRGYNELGGYVLFNIPFDLDVHIKWEIPCGFIPIPIPIPCPPSCPINQSSKNCSGEIKELQKKIDELLKAHGEAAELKRKIDAEYEKQKARLDGLVGPLANLCPGTYDLFKSKEFVISPPARIFASDCSRVEDLKSDVKTLEVMQQGWKKQKVRLDEEYQKVQANDKKIDELTKKIADRMKLDNELVRLTSDARARYYEAKKIEERLDVKLAELQDLVKKHEEFLKQYDPVKIACDPAPDFKNPNIVDLGEEPSVQNQCLDLNNPKTEVLEKTAIELTARAAKLDGQIATLKGEEKALDAKLDAFRALKCVVEFPKPEINYTNDNQCFAESIQMYKNKKYGWSYSLLDKMVLLLRSRPDYHLMVEGYASDNYTSVSPTKIDKYIADLSLNRGKNVKANLIAGRKRVSACPETKNGVEPCGIEPERVHVIQHTRADVVKLAAEYGVDPKDLDLRRVNITVLRALAAKPTPINIGDRFVEVPMDGNPRRVPRTFVFKGASFEEVTTGGGSQQTLKVFNIDTSPVVENCKGDPKKLKSVRGH